MPRRLQWQEELTPEQRSSRARAAALARNANVDRVAITEKARRANFAKWIQKVDPNNELPPQEQIRRAESARRAHMIQLAHRSHAARRNKQQSA